MKTGGKREEHSRGENKQLTLDKLQVRGRHDEDHSTLFRLPPFFLRGVDDGEDVALDEGKFIGVVASVAVCGLCFLCQEMRKWKILKKWMCVLGATFST